MDANETTILHQREFSAERDQLSPLDVMPACVLHLPKSPQQGSSKDGSVTPTSSWLSGHRGGAWWRFHWETSGRVHTRPRRPRTGRVAGLRVVAAEGGWRLDGDWPGAGAANRFLAHLAARGFAAATVRAYAYDTLNFGRFCLDRDIGLAEVGAGDIFDWIDWQSTSGRPRSGNVIKLSRFADAAPATVNRRVAAVRALFEHQVVVGTREDNPVPALDEGRGCAPRHGGCWAISGRAGHARQAGWCGNLSVYLRRWTPTTWALSSRT